MAKAKVTDYTRQLANGTKVHVAQHTRDFQPSADEAADGTTPVQNLRKQRLQQQAKERRAEAAYRGKAAAGKGWQQTKKRGKQSWRLAKKGGKRLQRAYRLAGRHKKAAATCAAVGGVAEIFGAVAWQGLGALITTLSILGATAAGGLLLGGPRRDKQGQFASNGGARVNAPRQPRPAGKRQSASSRGGPTAHGQAPAKAHANTQQRTDQEVH